MKTQNEKETISSNKEKLATLEQVKKNERNKPQALHSLQEKLKNFSQELSSDEKGHLEILLEGLAVQDNTSNIDNGVYTKPMQVHGGSTKEQDVYTKPMQVHGGTLSKEEIKSSK